MPKAAPLPQADRGRDHPGMQEAHFSWEAPMPHIQPAPSTQQHVSVMYGDGLHSFWLQRDATLAELAVHVGALDALHEGAPLTIDIMIEASPLRCQSGRLTQQITS
jgi:hypothetical protein